MEQQNSRREMIKKCLAVAATAGAAGTLSNTVLSTANAKEANTVSTIETFDLIIVGAGTGGLVTAIEAYDQGLKPLLIEKMDLPAGNSIYALGGVCACGTRFQKEAGIDANKEDLFTDMMAVSAGQADPALTRTYVEQVGGAVDWLQDTVGLKFLKMIQMPYPFLNRLHRIDGGGITGGGKLIRLLVAACKKRNIPLHFNTKAVELITDSSMSVSGVRALTDNGLVDFKARGGVVIASGGFSANSEMLTAYVGGVMAKIPLRGSPYVTGENISLAKPLFAKLVNLDQFHCGPILAATHVNPADALSNGHGVILDLRGKRIIDESNTYVTKARLLPVVTPENKAYILLDSRWAKAEHMVKKFTESNSPFFQDNTVEGLANKVGLPVDAVISSVNGYNNALKDNKLKELTPPCSYKTPEPLDRPPYYAFPYEAGMTATFGGPKINVSAQVVNMEDRPINGLYAVGNAAGGLFFKDYIGGSQLAGATVFGRIAARHIAQICKKANKA
ncbi:fumarate reductase [Shewanella mangrovi]|uniref:Fumarate reductase n=1 Tax=Shewanella mangrovi TaxID=1515746 RepID=A0A094JCN1_9GAMM|nr:FAD-dependent oxidoreductase [Shewanella mangrovi]KFZ36997.1 fumarate reductase [Shewanella mangrovi]